MDQQYFTTSITDRKRGQHLKFEDRCMIKAFHKLGYSLRRIAATLNCSPSTVLNKLRRGTGTRKGSRGRKPEALGRKRRSISHKNRKLLGTSIDERPEIAGSRIEYGHWEIDTVVGRKSATEPVILTLVEKKTNYYIAIKIPSKTSDAVFCAPESLREEYGEAYFSTVFQTITADNGSEFERLSEIESWGTCVYFVHPYSSWERPQNERHNRIFRRHVPKGGSMDRFTAEKILSFANEMNDLPRKPFHYATPEELFDEFLDQVYSVI